MGRHWWLAFGLAAVVAVFAFVWVAVGGGSTGVRIDRVDPAIHKIRHVVVIMQENRSFDSYFGTYPGADGIPMRNGVPTVCVPDPQHGGCQRPYHDPRDLNGGGPHGQSSATADIDGGADGRVHRPAEQAQKACVNPTNPNCAGASCDVMGYHDAREIPNYWAYANAFVLQDHMFEPNASWSLPAHLFMVSEWSAKCSVQADPMSCVNALQSPGNPPDFKVGNTAPSSPPDYAWTDLTYLLHKQQGQLGLLRVPGHPARLRRRRDDLRAAASEREDARDLEPAAVLRHRRSQDGQLGNIQPIHNFYTAPRSGHAARRLLDRPRRRRSASTRRRCISRRPDLRHRPDQRDHARPGLELDRDLPRLGRLGRLLRPRRPARRRPERLRARASPDS